MNVKGMNDKQARTTATQKPDCIYDQVNRFPPSSTFGISFSTFGGRTFGGVAPSD